MLSPKFYLALATLGFLKRGNSVIPIDTTGRLVMDPAMVWRFAPVQYLKELQLLFIKAEQVDEAEAQALMIKQFNRRI